MFEAEIKIYYRTGLGFTVLHLDPFTKRKIRTRFERREDAENHKQEIMQKINQELKENPGEMLVSDLVMLHIKDHPKTQFTRAKTLFLDFLDSFGKMKIAELTTETLRSWLNQLQLENDYKESTMFGTRVTLNVFFRDMARRGVVKVSPLEQIFYEKRPYATMRKPIILSEETIQDLLAKAKEYSPGLFYPLFLIFVETAAKSAEILELKWEVIDLKKGTVTFPGNKVLTKRTIPISQELLKCLSKRRPVSDLVFTSLYGEKMTKRKLSAYINEFKKHFGIKEKWMYWDLRHSFAHNFLIRGGDLKQLKAILGLRSIQTAGTVYGLNVPKKLEISSPFES